MTTGFKEAEARASGSQFTGGVWEPSFRVLQRGRGTCLGITQLVEVAKDVEDIASKRPRHVPRDHLSMNSSRNRTVAASKRPRHVPRDHAFAGSIPRAPVRGFKEAEARASGSPCGSTCRRILCDASKRPRHVPRDHEFAAHFSISDFVASKRPRHVPRDHLEDRHEKLLAEIASKRPRHVPRDHDAPTTTTGVAALASKRPRHVPRDHSSEISQGNPDARFKEAEARASGSLDGFRVPARRPERFKEAEARASGSPERLSKYPCRRSSFKEAEARASGSLAGVLDQRAVR